MGVLPPARVPMRAVMKNMKQAQCAEPANVSQEAVTEPAFYLGNFLLKDYRPRKNICAKALRADTARVYLEDLGYLSNLAQS